MNASRDDLDRFYAFGVEQLAANNHLSLDELLVAWDAERQRDTINEAIREGLADVDSGRTRPAEEWLAGLRDSVRAETP